jgi:hypothetical protein
MKTTIFNKKLSNSYHLTSIDTVLALKLLLKHSKYCQKSGNDNCRSEISGVDSAF